MGDHDAVERVITMAPIPVITIAWRMHRRSHAAGAAACALLA